MKRAMVYLIAISAVFTMLLSGCGETNTKVPPATATPTTQPQETLLPESMMPDESDGIVTDTDGIITEDDNPGTAEEGNGMDGDAVGSADGKIGGSGMTTGTAGTSSSGKNGLAKGKTTGAR